MKATSAGALELLLPGALVAEIAGVGFAVEPLLDFTRIVHMACNAPISRNAM